MQLCKGMSRVLVVTLALAAVCAQASAVDDAALHKQVSYKDYASLLAPAMLLSHGDWARADQAIAEMFKQAGEAIAGVAQVITGEQKPSFKINDPILFNNGATNVSTNVAGAQGLAVGINYNPCVISTTARGAEVTAAGVNIQPNVIEVLANGATAWPMGVNIQPALIYINPWGALAAPMGASIAPALIAVAPTAVAVGTTDTEIQTIGLKVPP
ncbi:hypothetical protein WJX81_005917 [Elliptochloris bilobata]|uniref:Uncharacterized protein n=1 Tax=Elliptochloris bilobata TaxID=381761 RepID=A0AAW1SKD0_9CHLO